MGWDGKKNIVPWEIMFFYLPNRMGFPLLISPPILRGTIKYFYLFTLHFGILLQPRSQSILHDVYKYEVLRKKEHVVLYVSISLNKPWSN